MREFLTPTVLERDIPDVEVHGRDSDYPTVLFQSNRGLEDYITAVAATNFGTTPDVVFGLIEVGALTTDDEQVEEMESMGELLMRHANDKVEG